MSSVICPECADYVAGPLVRDCKTCGGMGFLRVWAYEELARLFCKRFAGETVRGPGETVGRVDEALLVSWFSAAELSNESGRSSKPGE